MRTFTVVAVVVLLTGCATTAERAAQVERDVDEMIKVYGPACDKLGYRGDSDPWRECVLRLSKRDSEFYRYPTTTNCIGSRGFFSCTTF